MTIQSDEPSHEDVDAIVKLSEETIAKGSKSFAAAAKLFSSDTRHDAVMLYAWCRHADDVIDGQTLGHEQITDFRRGQMQRLVELRSLTQMALEGKPSNEPVFEALRLVMARHSIPEQHPLELINGFEMDVEERAYRTLEDTEEYCYHVAGVVGVMMSMIMGARDPAVLDRASDLGIAFQLTNIARDIIDDARAGRIYVPLDWLQEIGLDRIDLENADHWEKLHQLAGRLLARAEPHYASANAGIAALPWRSAWAIAAAGRVYRDIGSKLLRNGPAAWQKRVSTSKPRKMFLLALSLGDVVISRFKKHENGPDRSELFQRPIS